MEKNIIRISKYITKLLRHDPEDLSIDKNGWVGVKELITKIGISKSTLDYIVSNDNKGRMTYNSDETKIRANQGHSIDVDVELDVVEPPLFLYNGTSSGVIDIIMKDGLKKMTRNHVHLSTDMETAENVGDRHTKGVGKKTIILKVNSKEMSDDGYIFYLSKNGVYLTDNVPSKYLTILK